MEPYEEYLATIMKGIVDHPEDVVITKTTDAMGVLLSVRVHADDMGKVIGKGGKLVNDAIRPLVRACGLKHNARVSVKVDEPIGGKRQSQSTQADSLFNDAGPKTVDEVVDEL